MGVEGFFLRQRKITKVPFFCMGMLGGISLIVSRVLGLLLNYQTYVALTEGQFKEVGVKVVSIICTWGVESLFTPDFGYEFSRSAILSPTTFTHSYPPNPRIISPSSNGNMKWSLLYILSHSTYWHCQLFLIT